MDIVIFHKTVGGRIFDRYFHYWKNAEKLLLEELKDLKKSGWKVTRKTDKMNLEKGFWEYQYDLLTPDGEDASLSLIDGFFAD